MDQLGEPSAKRRRLAAMLHIASLLPGSARRPLAGALLAALTLAACAGTAGSSAAPPAAIPQPTPTAVPGDPGTGVGSGDIDPSFGGGSGGNVGTGILPPGLTFPVAPGPDEGLLGQARYLEPVQGLINQHTSSIQLVRAALTSDGKAFADLRWYSGVAPCSQLDSVKLAKDDAAKTIHLTVVEGSGGGDVACIDIAELHAVAVDLGDLASGQWTISAEGDAPAVPLDVP
jgi:hypothetical protein